MGPVEFYHETVLPAIFDDPNRVAPEFAWERSGDGWRAGRSADPGALTGYGSSSPVRPSRVVIRPRGGRAPNCFHVYGFGDVEWIDHLLGSANPRGEAFVDAVARIAGMVGLDFKRKATPLTPEERAELERRRDERVREAREAEAQERRAAVAKARKVYADAERGPLGLAARYFQSRGLAATAQHVGARVGRVSGPASSLGVLCPIADAAGELIGLQRILIDDRGESLRDRDGARRKLMVGRARGGAVRIGDLDHDRPVLVLAEGVETALAVHLATGLMVWACLSTSGLRTIDLPDALVSAVRRVVIAADLDASEAGQAAADDAAVRIAREYALEAEIATPGDEIGERKSVDWLDVYNAEGPEAVASAIADAEHRAHTPPPTAPPRDDPPPEAALFMPSANLHAARLYLEEEHSIPEGLGLMRHDDEWLRWTGRVWEPVSEFEVRQGVRRWATRKRKRKVVRERNPDTGEMESRVDPAPLNPSERQVSGILTAVADECAVATPSDESPARYWIRPWRDDRGDIDFGPSASRRHLPDGEAMRAGLPDHARIVAIRGGLIDVDAWARGRFVRYEHTARLYNRNLLDVDLDLARVARACAEERVDQLVAELAPEWLDFLAESFSADQDGGDQQCRELRKVVGYWLTPDNRLHSGNIAILHGPPGTGKTTTLEVVLRLLGPTNTVATQYYKLADGPHMASWRHKLLAHVADGDISNRTDGKLVVEQLATVSGGSAVSMRRLYKDETPNVYLTTRVAVVCNEMPRLDDRAGKLLRRMMVFVWRKAPERPDPDLLDRLTRPRSLAGVLLWALQGLRDLHEDGRFHPPAASAAALETYRKSSELIPDEFVRDVLWIWPRDRDKTDLHGRPAVDPESFVTHDELYGAVGQYLVASEGREENRVPPRNLLATTLLPMLERHGWGGVDQRAKMRERKWGRLGIQVNQAALGNVLDTDPPA